MTNIQYWRLVTMIALCFTPVAYVWGMLGNSQVYPPYWVIWLGFWLVQLIITDGIDVYGYFFKGLFKKTCDS